MGKKVVVFGSNNADLTGRAEHLPIAGETVLGDEFSIGPGGKGGNQAVAAFRANADVTFITKIADDVFGNFLVDFYTKEGFDTEYFLIDKEKSNGVALICVDKQTGQNQILAVPGACTNFNKEDIQKIRPVIESAGILLVQFEVNMDALEAVMDIAKAAGVMVVLNPAPLRKVDGAFLAKADIITPNELEAAALSGVSIKNEEDARNAAAVFHNWGVRGVLITMGKQGVFASIDGKSAMVPARIVEAIDTTGAGDSFNGAFVTALSEGMDFFKAVEFGNLTASLSVQKHGAALSMPRREEIDKIK